MKLRLKSQVLAEHEFYRNKHGKLYHGDCLKLLKLLPDESIDIVVTSPPYDELRDYEGYKWNLSIFKDVAVELYRVMKTGGTIVWVVNDMVKDGQETGTSFSQYLYFGEVGFWKFDTMIYKKSGMTFPDPLRYHPNFEFMFIITKGKPKTVNLLRDRKNIWHGQKIHGSQREVDGSFRERSGIKVNRLIPEYGARYNVWEYATGLYHSAEEKIAFKHPAIFPEKLVNDHLLSWSNKGDVVLDIFGGSGTTSKIAQKLGRKWILMEIGEKYCQLITDRMKEQRAVIFQ